MLLCQQLSREISYQKYPHLQLHGPFDFDIASDVLFQFLEHSLQCREGLMVLQILVEKSWIFLPTFSYVINLKLTILANEMCVYVW